MAFEMLSERLQKIVKRLRGQARLSESNMEEMLKEIRIALIDADVNNEVVKNFLSQVKEKMIGREVIGKINPGQMVVKIVNDEIRDLLGGEESKLNFAKQGPTVMMLVGLQGGGKTTMAAKLANTLKAKEGRNPMMVACDVYRPAAIDQLVQLGKQINVFVYQDRSTQDVVKIAKDAVEYAKYNHYDCVLIDTAGRLAIDEVLMQELKDLKKALNPFEILIIVDALSGQDAVNVARTFNDELGLTGALMTKLDSDARGGAALSISSIAGIRIKYIGVGEKIRDIKAFNPERMASRILGMGDVVELVEKAQEAIDEKQATKLMHRMLSGKFDLEDMLMQIESTRKMGPLGVLAKLIPGMPKISESDSEKAEARLKKTRVVIQSMTVQERRNPDILKASRKVRIAKGCGLQVVDVNNVLRQYENTKVQMKQMSSMFGGRFRR